LISGLTEYVILLDILLAYPNLLGTKGYVVVVLVILGNIG